MFTVYVTFGLNAFMGKGHHQDPPLLCTNATAMKRLRRRTDCGYIRHLCRAGALRPEAREDCCSVFLEAVLLESVP